MGLSTVDIHQLGTAAKANLPGKRGPEKMVQSNGLTDFGRPNST